MNYTTLTLNADGDFNNATIATPKNVLNVSAFADGFRGLAHGILYSNAQIRNNKKRANIDKQMSGLTSSAEDIRKKDELIKSLADCDLMDEKLNSYLDSVDKFNSDIVGMATNDKFIFACVVCCVGLPISAKGNTVMLKGADELFNVFQSCKKALIDENEPIKGLRLAINSFCNLWLKTDEDTLSESNGVTRRFTVDLNEKECRKLIFTVAEDIKWTKNGIVFTTSADKVRNKFAINCLLMALKKEFRFDVTTKSTKVVEVIG